MMKKIVYVYDDRQQNSHVKGQSRKSGYHPQNKSQNAKKYIGNTPRVGCGTWATDIGTENCTIYDRPY